MILALFARFMALPRWLHFALAGVGAALAFMLWLSIHDANIRREQKELDRAAYERALQQAELLAIKAKADAEQHSRKHAHGTDNRASKSVPAALAAGERHIAANRVCAQSRGSATSPTVTAASGDSAPSADGASAASDLVAVTADDVRVCSTTTQRLIEAREWALGLGG